MLHMELNNSGAVLPGLELRFDDLLMKHNTQFSGVYIINVTICSDQLSLHTLKLPRSLLFHGVSTSLCAQIQCFSGASETPERLVLVSSGRPSSVVNLPCREPLRTLHEIVFGPGFPPSRGILKRVGCRLVDISLQKPVICLMARSLVVVMVQSDCVF